MITLTISHKGETIKSFEPSFKFNEPVYRVEVKDNKPEIVKYYVRDILLKVCSPKGEWGDVIDYHNMCPSITHERADQREAQETTICEMVVVDNCQGQKPDEKTFLASQLYKTPELAAEDYSKMLVKNFKK